MLTNPQISLLSECRTAASSVRHFVDAIQMQDECSPEEEDALREILHHIQIGAVAFKAERGLYLADFAWEHAMSEDDIYAHTGG